jgi:hypothetical protein
MTTPILVPDQGLITRRSIFIGATASLLCAPAIVRVANLMMPVRRLPFPYGPQYAGFVDRLFLHAIEGSLRAGLTSIEVGSHKIPVESAQRSVALHRRMDSCHLTFAFTEAIEGHCKVVASQVARRLLSWNGIRPSFADIHRSPGFVMIPVVAAFKAAQIDLEQAISAKFDQLGIDAVIQAAPASLRVDLGQQRSHCARRLRRASTVFNFFIVASLASNSKYSSASSGSI